MRVFLSHSSKHKPLVREITHHLPDHIRPWIDEKHLLIGENITESIKGAIELGTDFVVLFVDINSATSAWVRKELDWALEHEVQLGHVFVLPIVLDHEAWALIQPATFRERKYIACVDFSEDGIKQVANSLASHLFAWLSRDASRNMPSLGVDLLRDAEKYLGTLAAEIRLLAQSHDRRTPLSFSKLYALLRAKPELRVSSDQHLRDLLLRLRQQGHLAGLVCSRDQLYVEEAYYGWKTTLFAEEKVLIGKKAIEFIESGCVVALDAGSTTIQIARELCAGIKLRSWEHLTVVTNSVSAAHELLTTAEEVGLEDSNAIIQVYIVGGRVRCNTLAVVPLPAATVTDFDAILDALGGATVCYVGANGIDWEYGFTTHDNPEIKTKKAMLKRSQQKFIVTDSSKFAMKQPNVFATFDEGIDLITTRGSDPAEQVLYEQRLSAKNTKLIYAN
jgi:DeoR/GlpR family transcriptional regulator of sugar metabolism